MSFDVHFQPCRYDGTTRERINPFTKKSQDVPYNEPLSVAEISAVLAVFKSAGATGPDDEGCRVVSLADGGHAEIFGGDRGDGCMFAIRGAGVTPLLAGLLFDVMVAGNWVLMEAGEDDVVIAPSLDCLKGAPRSFGQIVVAASGGEVAALLSGGFGAWKKYRDAVVSG
ncbi:MAG: hypothetical protein ABIP89_13785 [Polyangiaceae bacterium]